MKKLTDNNGRCVALTNNDEAMFGEDINGNPSIIKRLFEILKKADKSFCVDEINQYEDICAHREEINPSTIDKYVYCITGSHYMPYITTYRVPLHFYKHEESIDIDDIKDSDGYNIFSNESVRDVYMNELMRSVEKMANHEGFITSTFPKIDLRCLGYEVEDGKVFLRIEIKPDIWSDDDYDGILNIPVMPRIADFVDSFSYEFSDSYVNLASWIEVEEIKSVCGGYFKDVSESFMNKFLNRTPEKYSRL